MKSFANSFETYEKAMAYGDELYHVYLNLGRRVRFDVKRNYHWDNNKSDYVTTYDLYYWDV